LAFLRNGGWRVGGASCLLAAWCAAFFTLNTARCYSRADAVCVALRLIVLFG
jgi:hypothetical protein